MSHSLSTSDVITEDDTETFFREAMVEEGITPDAIEMRQHDPISGTGHDYLFIASKEINGEFHKAQTQLSFTEAYDPDSMRQEIAQGARSLAEHFENEMVDTVEVSGTRLRFCSAEGGWAECDCCGRRVALDDLLRGAPVMDATAEFSNPSPTPYDVQRFLQRLDSGEQEVLKLYLLGALRKRCRCEFAL